MFKSKIFLGFMIVAILAVGAFAFTAKAADCTLSLTLKQGMRGAEVSCLQAKLGVTPATGYFGSITKAKVMAFQATKGLVADGVVGAMTRAALMTTTPVIDLCPNGMTLASNCTLPPGGTTPTPEALCPNGMTLASNCTVLPGGTTPTGLAGTDGSIATMSQLSQYNNEEVGSGSKDVKVLGFDVKATKDGDIGLKSFKLYFDATGNDSGDSDRITDYLTSAYVYMGSTKVATVNAADFNKDSTGIYSKTVTLDPSTIVRADKTEKFYVSVDAVSNLDSGDIDSDSWTIALENVRYVDGSGVVTTETTAIPAAIDYHSGGDGVGISFVTFSSASDTELKISISSTTPAAGLSKVKAAADTADVVILKGKMKLDGTSSVWLDEVPFLFTTDATNVDALTPTVYLTIGGETYSESMTANAGTTKVITFDNLDLDLAAGSTTDFTVLADMNDIDAGTFDEGKYLRAELDSTRRALVVAENAEGDQLTDATEMTGTAMGNNQYFYSVAPKVEVVSTSITPVDNGSNPPVSATAKMKLKITAEGGTIYLNGDDETTASEEFITLTYDGGNASSSVSSYTFTPSGTYTVTNSGSDNEYYTLEEDQTMYVDIEALVTEAAGSAAVLVGMKGTAINFGTVVTTGATRSANVMNWSTLTDLLKTGKTTLDS